MHSLEADETAIGGKAKIGIRARQARQSIECYAIYSHKDRRRKSGLGVKLDPVRIVVIRHSKLNYPSLPKPFALLYLRNGNGSITEGDVNR
jgi:hypothetical protein